MSLRLLIGFSQPGQRGEAKALYIGQSGSEAESVRANDTTCASHLVVNNPIGIRKSNPRFVAGSAAAIASLPPSVDQSEIERLTLEAGEARERAELAEQVLAQRDALIAEQKASIEKLSNVAAVEVSDAEMQQRLAAVTAERDNLASQLEAALKSKPKK